MLVQLDIENVAVIEKASIEWGSGLCAITGETGAGKSLLINSLNMVLGSRSSKDLIREGADFAKVSAVFFAPGFDSILESAGIETDESNIILSRKLYRDGRNICHINSSPVNVSLLKEIGEKLVVIHGQHDSSALMDIRAHLHFLDAFSKNEALLDDYKSVFKEYKEVTNLLSSLCSDAASREREIDYLRYQTEEIEKAALTVGEEDELIARKKILENSQQISMHADKAHSLLGTDGAKELLYSAKRELEKLSEFDAAASSLCERVENLYYEAEELSRDVSSYATSVVYSPSELAEIDDRLDVINSLKRKHNSTVEEILAFYEESCEKISELLSFDESREELEKKQNLLSQKAHSLASEITKLRKESAQILSERLNEELQSLDMPACRIEFAFTPVPLYECGAEQAELLISTNPTDAPKSLMKIASGGEISRVMLAIKSVFSDFDNIPTLLFDEIDTGVSGRAAEKIALKMKKLSEKYQLILVTHLPVIAASAEHHFLIEKELGEQGFKTIVRPLSPAERISEVARIISGDNITAVSLENAAQMIEGFNKLS